MSGRITAALTGLTFGLLTAACSQDVHLPEPATVFQVTVVNTHPHDTGAYTQGLEFVDEMLLESTGRIGRSSIRLVEPETGVVLEQRPLTGTLYGEGATVVGDEVWQLTYRAESVLVRDLDGLEEVRRYDYDGEGWGLCYDGTALVMSNGSDTLTFRDPETFAEIRRVQVNPSWPFEGLNELECVAGTVWANVYQTNVIVAIDGQTGAVTGMADLSELVPEEFERSRDFVLNGIAHHPDTGRFWVTGKNWPTIYEIELTPES